MCDVGTIRLEADSPVKESVCEKCQGTNRLLHGLVYDDDFAHGIYFVEWCDGHHPERAAFLTLSLGAFGESTTADDRLAFGVELRAGGMSLTDEPVRDNPDLLGSFVPRQEALTMDPIDHVWHVVDHIVLDDPRLAPVQQWLGVSSSP